MIDRCEILNGNNLLYLYSLTTVNRILNLS